MAITATVGAGVLGAGASIFAASEQASAANKATDTQLQMYNQTRSDLMPYQNAGGTALTSLMSLLGLSPGSNSSTQLQQLRNTPGYQFALQQGQQGLDRSAAARGLSLSGGQIKDTINYNQGMADQLYGSTVNQYMGVAGLGENAAAQTGNAATQTGRGMANTQLAAGQDWASGITGAANNLGGALYQLGHTDPSQTGSYDPGYVSVTPDANGLYSGQYSDRRLKDNVVPIGVLKSGLPVYSFNYKGDTLPQIGVMSDDVRRVDPESVMVDPKTGFDRVDYGRVARLPPMRKAA